MTTNPRALPDWVRPSTGDRLVVFTPRGQTALALKPRRIGDALLARLHARTLDAHLAAGVAPETSRLLAVRAAVLTSPQSREVLARFWDEVTSAAAPHGVFDARVRVDRTQVRAAGADIDQLTAVLRAPQPVAACGVAAASELLRDGAGPLYNPGSGRDLSHAVREVIRHLGERLVPTA